MLGKTEERNMQELKQYAEMLKDPEMRAVIIQTIEEMKGDVYPIVQLIKETIGPDADKIIDDLIKWGASKAFVAYNAYRSAGFSKREAMQLTLNAREDLIAAMRNVN